KASMAAWDRTLTFPSSNRRMATPSSMVVVSGPPRPGAGAAEPGTRATLLSRTRSPTLELGEHAGVVGRPPHPVERLGSWLGGGTPRLHSEGGLRGGAAHYRVYG